VPVNSSAGLSVSTLVSRRIKRVICAELQMLAPEVLHI
jgi:hypothetical protein